MSGTRAGSGHLLVKVCQRPVKGIGVARMPDSYLDEFLLQGRLTVFSYIRVEG
jgi:hypothetical protein